ncbi:RNA ligase [Halobellus rarus]|uniref:RNA ligase n=1 Tax=Halobellus rarus TaxID=1126237 RepID=A0ABD6CMC8_9EURY|nr:RNA ligase [Halobellus rarus]
MDERAYFERLDSTASDPAELFEHFERRSVGEYPSHVLPSARHGIERGTVILDAADAIVRGYPSIPRVLALDAGVTSFFEADETIFAEEKLDGFNVRVADVGDDGPLAFTRGGYVCPYTTARVRELLDLGEFFEYHPEKMLCAELIGPETPYTTHDYEEVDSDAVRVFDVRDRESAAPLTVPERRDLCERYAFPQPRLFGRYDRSEATEEIWAAVEELDDDAREGVVMKTAEGDSMVKYTTESKHHDELEHAFSLLFDLGRDFVFSRITREAFQAAEFDESEERLQERAHDLGESILRPAVETIRRVEAGETVGERHRVRGGTEEIDALLEHLRDLSLTIDVEEDYREDDQRVVEFLKVAESTADRTQYYLEGGTYDE